MTTQPMQPSTNPPPIPVVPLPVEPMYANLRDQQTRPAVIGFIGITSIVMAAFAILAGFTFGFMDFGLLMAASAARSVVVAPVTASPVTVGTGGTVERLPGDGLFFDDRQNVDGALHLVRPLSVAQQSQLDEMLAEYGKAMFPLVSSLTAQQIAATVSSSRHIAYADTAGSDEFVLGTGRLEISDDRAVFFPIDGQPPVRTNAIAIPGDASVVSTLSPDQIRSILRTIDELNGAKVKTAQMTALVQTFQSPGQQVIVPTTDGSDPAWEIDSASTSPTGVLSVGCHHGSTYTAICCYANGTIGQSSIASSVIGPAGMPKINARAASTALLLTGVQFALAVFLLIAGIMVVRNNPRGAMLHWIYVFLKLPIAFATATASVWMWKSLIGSIPAGTGPNTASAAMAGAVSVGAIPAAIGCLYPVVLVFLLLSGSARQYYGSLRAE